MFADTARKLGGEAAEGFDQVLNEQTAGSLVALSSIVAIGRGSMHPTSISEIQKLNDFLGKYRKSPVFLRNIEIVKMQYIKRSPDESRILRSAFDNGVRKKFVKSIADNSNVVQRLSETQRGVLSKGGVPDGYQVHHKLPLDDSGTNSFDNLVLIKNEGIHPVFTNAQANISRSLTSGGEAPTVLWPKPKGVIYP
ncbi:HNH endonuclease signature motif containing protein [Erwinia typographi]|uniref:HNH endonuclease signature motif containing protein n=1 Tax=Erwinia typographi TaxID=371042 RepID=UPI001E3D33EA|nr:HNH endonuclease signature motif containing protein [Erwinia typographi]